MMRWAYWVLALGLALGAGFVHARSDALIVDLIDQPALQVDKSPAEAAVIKKAFLTAGTRLGWSFTEEAPDRLVGTLVVRNRHTAVVEISLRSGAFDLKYRSSVNLHARETPNAVAGNEPTPPAGARVTSGGVWTIHPSYTRWVRNLVAGVRAELGS